jgi:hypothetical protein
LLLKNLGLRNVKVIHFHRFGFGNFLGWIGSHKPSGNSGSELGREFDLIWKAFLENKGISDYIYIIAEK